MLLLVSRQRNGDLIQTRCMLFACAACELHWSTAKNHCNQCYIMTGTCQLQCRLALAIGAQRTKLILLNLVISAKAAFVSPSWSLSPRAASGAASWLAACFPGDSSALRCTGLAKAPYAYQAVLSKFEWPTCFLHNSITKAVCQNSSWRRLQQVSIPTVKVIGVTVNSSTRQLSIMSRAWALSLTWVGSFSVSADRDLVSSHNLHKAHLLRDTRPS